MPEVERTVTLEDIRALSRDVLEVRAQLSRVIVGQADVQEGLILALLAGGHVLLEGAPGVGKTLLVRTLGQVLDLRSSRIQFTPDLMPTDILGTTMILEEPGTNRRRLEFRPGPLFSNLVLADEINRATPKTQSALLEAMQERTVTTLQETHAISPPFFVLATQNPIEMEGTYPLPEAQLDRFLLKLEVQLPTASELGEILDRTSLETDPGVGKVLSRERLLEMMALVRQIPVSSSVRDYIVRLVRATHPQLPEASPEVRRYVRLGASARGAQALLSTARIRACLRGEPTCSIADVKSMAKAALKHRLCLSFEGQAEGIDAGSLIQELTHRLPEAQDS